jgi:hypothetical protein
MVPDASTERNAFIFKSQVIKEDQIHEIDITTFLETSGTTVPKKGCRMPVDLNIFLHFARVSVAIECNGKAQLDV